MKDPYCVSNASTIFRVVLDRVGSAPVLFIVTVYCGDV